MPEYRRIKINGGTYFLTLVTYQRQGIFSTAQTRVMFLDAVHHVGSYYPFSLKAYCILPDHIHLICRMPKDEANYSMRISLIKRRFSKQYIDRFGVPLPISESYEKRKEVPIWQRRFWEHLIRDEMDLNHHFDYIHYNPVKHGLVNRVYDWEYSSFHDFVRAGYYSMDWGQDYRGTDQKYSFGE